MAAKETKETQDEMDPELAALLGSAGAMDEPPPDFSDIFGEKKATSKGETVDIGLGTFPAITKRFEEKGHDFFNDPNYYKIALSNEGDIAEGSQYSAKIPYNQRPKGSQRFPSAIYHAVLGISFKCRPESDRKTYPAKKIPASFRDLASYVFKRGSERVF